MRRRVTPELMDAPGVGREELAGALGYLRALNARVGGVSASLKWLKRWSRGWPRAGEGEVSLLDVATGGADIPIAARRWALGAGFDLRITGIDVHETTLELARGAVAGASKDDARIGEGITLVRSDARRLVEEFGALSFDYAHASLFLHHLPDIEVLTVLRVMDRVSRRGVIWNDLVRSRLHRFAARVGTIGAPAIAKHDAVVSVEAGFTKREALDIAHRVGIESARWSCPWGWYRFTVVGEKAS